MSADFSSSDLTAAKFFGSKCRPKFVRSGNGATSWPLDLLGQRRDADVQELAELVDRVESRGLERLDDETAEDSGNVIIPNEDALENFPR